MLTIIQILTRLFNTFGNLNVREKVLIRQIIFLCFTHGIIDRVGHVWHGHRLFPFLADLLLFQSLLDMCH